MFLLSRRGRKLLGRVAHATKKAAAPFLGLFIVCFALLAPPAHADLGQLTIALGLSPYKPDIDSEKLASGKPIFPIYQCFYKGQTLPELSGEVDTHLYDGFGSLQFSLGFGIAQASGFAEDTTIAATHVCNKPTTTAVQLTMLNVRPGFTYRLDPLLDLWGVPFVPYVRGSVVGVIYGFTQGGAFEKGTVPPAGIRFGWEGAVGMMLALDFLDSVDPFLPDTTKRGRANGAFDHTFVYVEGSYMPVNGFYTTGFVFSPDDTFMKSKLPILWTLGIAVELL